MAQKPKILLSNDDGINSPGLLALKQELASLGRIIVVAPAAERSACSHALTINRPVRVNQIAEDVYSVDGTPADAVYLALNGIILDGPPDIVVSGINRGANIGDDVNYSGTVAAAKEAAMVGLPAFAISNVGVSDFQFDGAAAFASRLVSHLLENALPNRTFLNVNVPNVGAVQLPEHRFTRLGKRVGGQDVNRKSDSGASKIFLIGGREPDASSVPNSDLEAIADGAISITPIAVDQTDHAQLEWLKKNSGRI